MSDTKETLTGVDVPTNFDNLEIKNPSNKEIKDDMWERLEGRYFNHPDKDTIFKSAGKALEEEFPEYKHIISQKVSEEVTSASKIPEFPFTSSFKKCPDDHKHLPSKGFVEAKQLISKFKKNIANYPHYMSHEGSTILCVLISVGAVDTFVQMKALPDVDKELIKSLLPKEYFAEDSFYVKFDETKDFILTFRIRDKKAGHEIRLFNTVIHPKPEEKGAANEDYINIDGQKFPSKQKLQRLAGLQKQESVNQEKDDVDYSSRRQPVSGRNAYEIRSDVLQMAIDWANNRSSTYSNPSDVINLAKEFYRFVENKR